MDIDTALEGIQIVIATTTVTVAIDPKIWHCDDAYIYSLGGCDCGKIHELCQCVSRCGRRGIGDGPGQISNAEIWILRYNPFCKGKTNKTLETESLQQIGATARYNCHLKNIKLQEKIKMVKIQDEDSGFSSVDQSRLGVHGQELDDLPWLSGCVTWGLTEAGESKDGGSYLWWMIANQNNDHVKVKKDPTKKDSKNIIGFGKAEAFGYMELSSGLMEIFPDIDNATKLLKEPADQYNFAMDALIHKPCKGFASSQPTSRDSGPCCIVSDEARR